MARQWHDLERESADLNRPGLVYDIDRRSVGKHKVGQHRVERVCAAVEKDRLQYRIAEHGFVERRRIDLGSRALDEEGIATKVIGMPVRRHDRDYLGAQLVARCL